MLFNNLFNNNGFAIRRISCKILQSIQILLQLLILFSAFPPHPCSSFLSSLQYPRILGQAGNVLITTKSALSQINLSLSLQLLRDEHGIFFIRFFKRYVFRYFNPNGNSVISARYKFRLKARLVRLQYNNFYGSQQSEEYKGVNFL